MSGRTSSLQIEHSNAEMLRSTYLDNPRCFEGDEIRLRANEGLVLRSASVVT